MGPRPVASRQDATAIQQLASRCWPRGWHPGGLGWALARNRLADHLVVFDEQGGDRVVAWAGSGGHGAGELLAQVDGACLEVADEAIAWLSDSTDATTLSIELANDDAVLEAALDGVGFRPRPGGEVRGLRRPAVLSRAAGVPEGYSVRPVGPGEVEARVNVHRAAWKPALLPWHPDHAPEVEPGAESPFSEEAYESVCRTWLYEPELDLVAVSPDGELAGCCIAWLDPATGVAEIEPLGVAPTHRGRGLAAALCEAVAARVADAGGHEVFINTSFQVEYPAPGAAYAKAGFEEFPRASTYVLERC